MAPARSTEGSKRVRNANHARVVASTTRRSGAGRRSTRHVPSTPAVTSATWVPDTAVRWVREVACIAARSTSGSSRVSPVARPASSPPTDGGVRPAAARRTRSRTCSLTRAHTPPPPSSSQRRTSSATVACWRASHRPYPPSGSGRAVARAANREPRAGGSSVSNVVVARSRVTVPSTPVTRTTTCQPVAIRRGSCTTAPVSSAWPPWSASAGNSPHGAVATRAALVATPTASTVTSSHPPTAAAPGVYAPTIGDPRVPAPARRAGRVSWRRARPAVTAAPTASTAVNVTHAHGCGAAPRCSPIAAPRTSATAHSGSGPSTSPVGGRRQAASSASLTTP